MSDVPPAAGWWKASDGNWYPPQAVAVQPPAPAKSNKGCIIAVAIVFGMILLIGVISVVAISFFAHKASDKLEQLGDAVSTPELVNPDNLDARDGDKILDVGHEVRISGFTTKVESVEFTSAFENLSPGSYLVVDVTVENRDAKAQPYNLASDWKLQTPDGVALPPANGDLSTSGSLEAGGKITGQIAFPVGDQTGPYFVLYRPDVFDKARGVWVVAR